jgi:hypothetical protein
MIIKAKSLLIPWKLYLFSEVRKEISKNAGSVTSNVLKDTQVFGQSPIDLSLEN